MRLATFNVNGIRGRLDNVLEFLSRCQPDVVCLQELKAPRHAFPADELKRAGYAALWHGQARWNGVAILSRVGEPIETRRVLPGDPDPSQARYLEAAVNGLIVGGLYAPNGNPRPGTKFDYKLAWLRRLKAHAQILARLDAPVILIGDYNIIPTPEDVYKPERWTQDALFAPEARKLFADIMDTGWTDALLAKSAGVHPYTFWPYWRRSFERNAGIRIDHALVNASALKQLQSAYVDRATRGAEHASDHAPVILDLSSKR